jgi:hypothetical protein
MNRPVRSREEADQAVQGAFLKVLAGHKADRTPGGRRSRARKNWNPEYFRIRGWLRKKVGCVFACPARPVLTPPPPDRMQGYGERVKTAILEDLK